MDGFLSVNNAGNLPVSPSNSFLADEVASICPLITPSPPTNDLINPLPEPIEPNLGIGHELAIKLQHAQDEDKADSASSSSSALAEPACAQLLNHRNVYHHIVKDEETEMQESNGRTQPLQLTFRNPPDNYFFMSWNWPLIRKISLWFFLAGLAAMVAIVIAMIYTLPKKCNPQTEWYQGNVFYEVFPPSFYAETNSVGNFTGIAMNSDYFSKLGVRAVRLNSIFRSSVYPYDFWNATSLVEIDNYLGNLTDFTVMVKKLKAKNISLILDLPVYPLISTLSSRKNSDIKNETTSEQVKDKIEYAIHYWTFYGVDGFYLKGLENLVDDPNFASSLRTWKKILGPDRIIIVSETVIDKTPKPIINIVLNNVDLVDVKLDLTGATAVTQKIGSLQNGTLFSKPGMPWIHWSLGNVNSRRLVNVLPYSNTTLGATLLQLMLPGTPSIFYGDEIGLHEILESDNEHQNAKHLHQLNMMPWKNHQFPTENWIHSKRVNPYYEQFEPISKLVSVREKSPSIYMNSIYKEGVSKANVEVQYTKQKFLVVQRWYPRRKAYVVVANIGDSQQSEDLSTILYSGEIVAGPPGNLVSGSITFKNVSLWPGESVVVELH